MSNDYFKEIFLNKRFTNQDLREHFRIVDDGHEFTIIYYEMDFKNLKINDRIKMRKEFNKMMSSLENINDILKKSEEKQPWLLR